MNTLRLFFAFLTLLTVLAVGPASTLAQDVDPLQAEAERPDLRNANSKTYDLGNGTFRTEISTGPVHYKDDRGRWQDIDTSIGDVGPDDLEVTKVPFRARFKRNFTSPYRFEVGDGWVQYRAQGANVSLANVAGNIATFTDAWTDTDVVVAIGANGFKQDLVLRSISAPSAFSWTLTSNRNITWDAGLNVLVYSDPASLQPVASIPAPFAVDANGDVGPVTLGWDGAGTVTFTVDAVWRASAAYPITVDPSTTIRPDPTAGKDSYTHTAFPDSNFGADVELKVDQNATQYAFIQFPLTSIPSGGVITAASIDLWTSQNDPTNVWHAKQVDATWTEATITWNNQPAITGGDVATGTMPAAQQTAFSLVGAPLVTLVQGWHDGVTDNNGIRIESNDTNSQAVWSSDYVAIASRRPALSVTWTVDGCLVTTDAEDSVAMTRDGVTSGNYNATLDDPGGDATLTGFFQYGFAPSSYTATSTTVALTDATATFTAPIAAAITPGANVFYRAAVTNEAGTCFGSERQANFTMPSVNTLAATGATFDEGGTLATLRGNLTALGVATSVFGFFEWGNGNVTDRQILTSTGTFEATITGFDHDGENFNAVVEIDDVEEDGNLFEVSAAQPSWFTLYKYGLYALVVTLATGPLALAGAVAYKRRTVALRHWAIAIGAGAFVMILGPPLVEAFIASLY